MNKLSADVRLKERYAEEELKSARKREDKINVSYWLGYIDATQDVRDQIRKVEHERTTAGVH